MHQGGAEEARRKEGPEEGFRDFRPKVSERQSSSRGLASHDRNDPVSHDEKTYE